MRKFLLILLAMLVPLQSSYAAAATLCAALSTGITAQLQATAPHAARDEIRHAHGGEAHDQPAAETAHQAATSPDHPKNTDHASRAHDAGACDDECSGIAHHACCHASAVALPAAVAGLSAPSATAAASAPPALPPASPHSDGLFRPPRTMTA